MSSGKRTGPQVKHCARIALPNSMTQSPPPPHTDILPSTDDILVSTVMLKSDPLPPPPCSTPLKKKHTSSSQCPFFSGVYGWLLYSLTSVHHYSMIPQGKFILFNYFRRPFHMNKKVVPMSLWTFMIIYGLHQRYFSNVNRW